MIPSIKEDILHVLKHGLQAIRQEDVRTLKELSNSTIHNASIYQEENSVFMAVVFYTLSKIYERQDYKQYPGWVKLSKNLIASIESIKFYLEKDDLKNYKIQLFKLVKNLQNSESKLNENIKSVFEAAKIHKASRLHEHGISIGTTAELLGVSEWELLEYIGKTGIADMDLSVSMDVKKRLNLARQLFK